MIANLMEDLIAGHDASKWLFYDQAVAALSAGIGTFASSARTPWKIALFTQASNAGDLAGPKVYGDLTNEVATGNGYTRGGADTSVQWVTTGETTSRSTLFALGVEWLASGGPLAARYAVMYKNETAKSKVKPLFGVCVLETTTRGDLVAADGHLLTIEINPLGVCTMSEPPKQ